jgi:hypothetical protein
MRPLTDLTSRAVLAAALAAAGAVTAFGAGETAGAAVEAAGAATSGTSSFDGSCQLTGQELDRDIFDVQVENAIGTCTGSLDGQPPQVYDVSGSLDAQGLWEGSTPELAFGTTFVAFGAPTGAEIDANTTMAGTVLLMQGTASGSAQGSTSGWGSTSGAVSIAFSTNGAVAS